MSSSCVFQAVGQLEIIDGLQGLGAFQLVHVLQVALNTEPSRMVSGATSRILRVLLIRAEAESYMTRMGLRFACIVILLLYILSTWIVVIGNCIGNPSGLHLSACKCRGCKGWIDIDQGHALHSQVMEIQLCPNGFVLVVWFCVQLLPSHMEATLNPQVVLRFLHGC